MSQAVTEHRQAAPASLDLAVMTVSDTRTLESDSSGALIVSLAEAAGHRIIERLIVADEPNQMRPTSAGLELASECRCHSGDRGNRN